jgi:hypothetical protein
MGACKNRESEGGLQVRGLDGTCTDQLVSHSRTEAQREQGLTYTQRGLETELFLYS